MHEAMSFGRDGATTGRRRGTHGESSGAIARWKRRRASCHPGLQTCEASKRCRQEGGTEGSSGREFLLMPGLGRCDVAKMLRNAECVSPNWNMAYMCSARPGGLFSDEAENRIWMGVISCCRRGLACPEVMDGRFGVFATCIRTSRLRGDMLNIFDTMRTGTELALAEPIWPSERHFRRTPARPAQRSARNPNLLLAAAGRSGLTGVAGRKGARGGQLGFQRGSALCPAPLASRACAPRGPR